MTILSGYTLPHSNNGEPHIVITDSVLPDGASTSANQTTMIGHLTDIETAVQNIDLDTSQIDLNTDNLETLITAGNASLTSIDTEAQSIDAKLPAQGSALTASSLPVNIASDQTVPVSMASIPLATGASTEAKQDTMIGHLDDVETKLDTINTTMSGTLTVDGSGVTQPVSGTFWQSTQPVSASSLPLPTGASTEATLSSLNGKVPSQGSALTASSIPVNIASDQTVPVSGTFWQSTQPVSASSLPLPTGASTEATLSSLNGKVTACDTGDVTISNASLAVTQSGG